MPPAVATDPSKSEAQRRAMFAAAAGRGNLGIPSHVAKEFTESDPGGKLPEKAKDMTGTDWRGLLRGLFKFLSEEAQEKEHAEDQQPALATEPSGGIPTALTTIGAKGRAASILFASPSGKMLFVKRADDEKNFPSYWSLPGGKADDNEEFGDCARREAKEELGNCTFDGMKELERKNTPYGWEHATFYVPATDEFKPTLNGEHSDFIWADPDHLPEPLHPGVKATIDELATDEGKARFSLPPDTSSPPHQNPRQVVRDASELSDTTRKNIGSPGSETREDMPEDAFLGPDNTYPVKEKRDGEWRYTRKLLEAAAARARLQDRSDIERKANAIREREFPDEKAEDEIPDQLAFDRDASTRTYDADNRLHIDMANISKAAVNPYYGKEINEVMRGRPGWQLLDDDKKYHLLRDPEELRKAKDTFNRIPVLSKHVPINADNHKSEYVIGSLGENSTFEEPYLKNGLVIWPRSAIDAVENEDRKQLSASYRYRADMTPGDYNGVSYDGVMRDIVGNHVALVRAGRAGEDVAIGDEHPDALVGDGKGEDEMTTTAIRLSPKALVAKGALMHYLLPRLAKDEKVGDLNPLLKDLTSANYHGQIRPIAAKIRETFKPPRLAKDADLAEVEQVLEAVGNILDATGGDPDPVPDDFGDDWYKSRARDARNRLGRDETDEERDERERRDEDEEMRRRLGRDESEEEKRDRLLRFNTARDARRIRALDESEEEERKRREEEEKKGEDRKAMDQAIRVAVDQATTNERKNQREIREAESAVRPFIGEVRVAFDSADEVYGNALKLLGVKTEGVHPSAFRALLEMAPRPASGHGRPLPRVAGDAAAVKPLSEMVPGIVRIERV